MGSVGRMQVWMGGPDALRAVYAVWVVLEVKMGYGVQKVQRL